MPLLPPLFSPLDEALGLVPGELGPRALEGLVRLAARMPFAQAAGELAFFWGVVVSAETARRVSEGAGAAVGAVEAAETARVAMERPAPPPGPALLLVSVDGAMVPLIGGKWAEVKTMAVGAVGVATGEGGPAARTTDLSYFSQMAEAAAFTQAARGEAHRRGVQTAGTVVAVQDGAPWTQAIVDASVATPSASWTFPTLTRTRVPDTWGPPLGRCSARAAPNWPPG